MESWVVVFCDHLGNPTSCHGTFDQEKAQAYLGGMGYVRIARTTWQNYHGDPETRGHWATILPLESPVPTPQSGNESTSSS
jgi:hypothetical protein